MRWAPSSAELIDAFCEPDLALPEVYELLVGAIAAIASRGSPRIVAAALLAAAAGDARPWRRR